MDRLAIVIVTFKRQELLSVLFNSILQLTQAPWRVVVVDNENSPKTAQMVSDFAQRMNGQWGSTVDQVDSDGGTSRVCYDPQKENTGGSGGFSEGVRRAYELGAEWFWLMDDDVAVLPEALDRLDAWTDRYDVIQGQRYDYDGTPFFWQHHFVVPLCIYNPLSRAGFNGADHIDVNVMCFEGGLFRRRVVQKIGLPDYRFFIYYDDAIYGYLASKVTQPVLVPDFILRRTREVRHQEVGASGVRQISSTSDMTRFYIMRNRGCMARYFKLYGDYNPVGYGFGTFLSFAKEVLRLLMVDRKNFGSGWKRLWAGYRDSKRVLHDPSWKPMPPLE
ncbi:MAG: glycosyltransferase [Tractidigestivibacter sp.]|jgi:rhamnopyranosyl-N-acetylglucosaminyl-diphospho-decaprenol beta-1,3/1,4-galactofuranosyltransferase|uniref:glycosyltransferase n=1 Tax=Tractidigestivibacter sp. TaxID=2847320 RepID=UPI003D8E6C8F